MRHKYAFDHRILLALIPRGTSHSGDRGFSWGFLLETRGDGALWKRCGRPPRSSKKWTWCLAVSRAKTIRLFSKQPN